MQSATTQPHRITVFIVEDHEAVRKRLVSMLDCAECFSVVGEAETPRDAIEGILTTSPDSVVLDIQLTGGSGLDVLREVRALDPDIEFFVLTNHHYPQYCQAFMAAGANCVLDKSTEFADLPGVIAAAGTKPHRSSAKH